jgi:spore maturation protein A
MSTQIVESLPRAADPYRKRSAGATLRATRGYDGVRVVPRIFRQSHAGVQTMLNYIWAGLIVSSFVFALGYDVRDIAADRYRNDQPLPVELAFTERYDPAARRVPVQIRIDGAGYGRFYRTGTRPAATWAGYLLQTQEGVQLRFDAGASLPEPLATIAGVSRSRDGELQGRLTGFAPPATAAAGTTAAAGVIFDRVRFVKLNAIAAAALDFAETAAQLALGLIGVLSLFLGMLKIAEQAGVIQSLVKVVRPVLRPLFPEVPPDHPALGMIALNLTANVFGLGNAATPFGIKAMEELQKLNPTDDTATNPMVMLLAINTASVQLVPPVLLLALMGLQINQLIFAIIITTALSLIIAIAAAKLYGRLPRIRASDPNRTPPPDSPLQAAAPGA